MRILVVGSVALDTVKTPAGKKKEVLGGSATYSSTSASFFSPVGIVAVVGRDFPKRYILALKEKKIDLDGLIITEGKTFRWAGEYDSSFCDPRTVLTELNVFANFKPVVPPSYRRSPFVFLANIDPHLQQDVLRQMYRPRLVLADTMNYWIRKTKRSLIQMLKNVDIFLLNESEAKELAQTTNILKAAKKILRMGPEVVIIKRGEYGAVLMKGNRLFCLPAFLLEKVVDPTGAGDTFAGGVIGYLSQMKRLNYDELRKAVVYGTVMASFAVESFSLERLFSISRKDINERIKKFKQQVGI